MRIYIALSAEELQGLIKGCQILCLTDLKNKPKHLSMMRRLWAAKQRLTKRLTIKPEGGIS